jgi:hypothetical protein
MAHACKQILACNWVFKYIMSINDCVYGSWKLKQISRLLRSPKVYSLSKFGKQQSICNLWALWGPQATHRPGLGADERPLRRTASSADWSRGLIRRCQTTCQRGWATYNSSQSSRPSSRIPICRTDVTRMQTISTARDDFDRLDRRTCRRTVITLWPWYWTCPKAAILQTLKLWLARVNWF